MYLYESHLGALYVTDYEFDFDELYCEECGCSDWFIGVANTRAEAWDLIRDDIDVNGSGGWDFDYVREMIESNWDE